MTKTPIKILVAEDSQTQAERLRNLLEEQGYEVQVASNGYKALELLSLFKPSLVISDIMMAEMDGYELCRRIRADATLKNLPIVLLTSLADPEDIVKGLTCGADNFVTKPFEKEDLLYRIEYITANQRFRAETATIGVEIVFAGKKHFITSDKLQILNLLFSTYDAAVKKNRELIKTQTELRALTNELEERVRQRTVALTNEILEHKRDEEKVREQAALLDKASDAIIVCDLNNLVQYWNRGAEHIYKWNEFDAIGQKLPDLFGDDEGAVFHEAKRDVLEQGEWLGEMTHSDKSGRRVIIQSRWTLMHDEKNLPKSFLIINTDITASKESEARFLRVQRMNNIGALAGGIAHDLNNSLSPILMASDLLREEISSENGQKLLSAMVNGAQRGADMVKQILSFSRGASGQHVVIQLKHLISEIREFAQSTFPRSVQIKTRFTEELLPVLGDATQLHQVLLNLCVNARDAMPHGGILTIEAKNIHIDVNNRERQTTGPHVAVSVTDTGTGISPEAMSKIFEPFFTTKELGRGTGLGLSTVNGIIKTHCGFLKVSSELGKGTTFEFFLPAAAGDAKTPAKIRNAAPHGKGELILIVDDETAILEMTQLMLEVYDYKIVTAKNGDEGLEQFLKHQNEIRAVVTDLMMPNMDGNALIVELKNRKPAVKIIGVSGLAPEAVLQQSIKHLVDLFLTKPYNSETLLIRLRELLTNRV